MVDDVLAAGFARASAADLAEVRQFIEAMIRRKEELFAANRRAILSFELTDRGDDFYLAVASSL